MKIISVQPKDIYVTVELSLKQVGYLLNFLGMSKVEYGDTEEEKKAVEYITKNFFPTLNRLEEDLKKENVT